MLPLAAVMPLAALGGAALGMPVGQYFDAPRKWMWKDLLGLSSDSGEEVVRDWMVRAGMMPPDSAVGPAATGGGTFGAVDAAAGEDQKPMFRTGQPTYGDYHQAATAPTMLTKALGTGMEMVLDPFSLGGSIIGGGLGRMLTSKMAPVVAKAPLQQAMGRLDELEGIAGRHIPTTIGVVTVPPTSMTQSTYIPEILDELPDVMKLSQSAKTYAKVSPEAAELTQRLGLGSPSGAGLNVMQKPSFLEGRGGKMFLGQNAPTQMQYEDVLTGLPPDVSGQTFGQVLGQDLAMTAREAAPWARGRSAGKPSPNAFMGDAQFGGEHLMDMPMSQVPGGINALRGALMNRLSGVDQDLARNSPAGAVPKLLTALGGWVGQNTPPVPIMMR